MTAAPGLARIAVGAMRLSTEPGRDGARGIAVLHAAFDAGIALVDTADAYCLDDSEIGHNERLVAQALATWEGDRSRIRVATKGGLTRPQGHWIADGRARHLTAACEASRRALGVERIHLYQLHAPDPRTPLATSVRALAALQRDGAIESIGLCNVTVGQIDEARQIAEIASVQNELSIWKDEWLLNGTAEYCVTHGIRLLAYRPLGGTRRVRRTASDRLLSAIAERHTATAFEMAIAWILDLSPHFTVLAGATRVATIASLVHAGGIALTDQDRAQLDDRIPAGRRLRAPTSVSMDRVDVRSDGEVVLIMGLPGAGKSTVADAMETRGYRRLNRDTAGGSLNDLLPELDRLAASGVARIVLDNTYVSRKSRAGVIAVAAKHRLPVRCVWLSTGVEDAQVNAAGRILSRYGRLLEPDEMRAMSKRDVSVFPPGVQLRYQRELEPPDSSEGFAEIEIKPFTRAVGTASTERALILWCDGVLRRSRAGGRTPSSADDVEVLPDRAETLVRYRDEGWRLLGISWQPEVSDGTMSAAQVDECFAKMRELLGVAIEVEYCPHPAGPPVCWCRKPLPGLGVVFVKRYYLDPSRSIYVGSGPQDPGFARRLGFQYQDADEFFAARHRPQR